MYSIQTYFDLEQSLTKRQKKGKSDAMDSGHSGQFNTWTLCTKDKEGTQWTQCTKLTK